MNQQTLFAAAALLGVAACSSTGSLESPKPDANISGTVTRAGIEPHRVEVTLNGKTYRGEWRTRAATAEQKQAAGLPHQKHIGQVRSTLSADDGSKLECQWQTHGDTGEGICKAGDREYLLNLK